MEYNDVYDALRNRTGKIHRRGTPWKKGEYGFVVCVWVYDGEGKVLMTRRAPQKSFAGTWENSGGSVQAGEDSLQAIVRELREETGIHAAPEEFEFLESGLDHNTHYDYYCLKKKIALEEVILQPGETDDVRWVTYGEIHHMIETGMICHVIATQFLRQEPMLLARTGQPAQNG